MKTAEEILKSMYLKYHGYEMPFIPPYIIEAMKEYAKQSQPADEEINPILIITDKVKELNWSIAIPTGGGKEDDGNVHGMIIGEKSYIDYILKHLE